MNTRLDYPSNRFYCDRCDTDFETMWPNEISAFCPYCEKLIYKLPVCGLCRKPISKNSKGKKCGFCGAVFTNTFLLELYRQHIKPRVKRQDR